ncbi:hypothetical protein [Bifidobacterium sp. SO1]|uniref:hypothetical protein n=1 Tax=Bifidobacterium sp. SO1 TaxID=2809029 RepID=UPI001BDDA8A1|nr:hypothetical protein [Bifidobacterium sp. SO1]MBT1161245.1 hypothetical protein [Bifidobacterium sp. SO1]
MTKNMRVTWDELLPGDLIHVKGSKNTYRFVQHGKDRLTKAGGFAPVEGTEYSFVDFNDAGIHPIGDGFSDVMPNVVILYRDFAYATRPLSDTHRVTVPTRGGEYWLRNENGWHKLLVIPDPVFSRTGNNNTYLVSENTYSAWDVLAGDMHPREVLTAEEYYTRRIKGEL